MAVPRPILLVRRAAALAAVAGCAAVLLAVACGDATDASAPLVAGDAGGPIVRAGEDDGDRGAAQVLAFLLADSDTEVVRAKAAAERSPSDGVKEFAALTIAEHGAMSDRLRALARDRALPEAPSQQTQELLDESRAVDDELARRKGVAFDRRYLQEEVVLHLKTMAMLERAVGPLTQDPGLTRLVSEATDAAVAHRERARELLRALPSDAGIGEPESTSSSSSSSSSSDAGAQVDARPPPLHPIGNQP